MEGLRVFVIARRVWLGVGAAALAGVIVWRFVGRRQDQRLIFRPAPPVSSVAVGLLVGTAVGDAKGLPYETLTKEQIALAPAPPANQPFASFFEAGQFHPAFPIGTPPGRYSDDTQLSIAVIAALLKAEKFDMQAMVESHVAAFDERTNGWGGATKDAIKRLKEGVLPTQSGTKTAKGNGVLIKLAPLCFWYALKGTPASQVSIEVEALTRLTHDNAFCVVIALVHARALIRAFINGSNNADYYQSPEARRRFLSDAIKDAEELERQYALAEEQKISPRLTSLLRNFNDLTDTRLLEASSGGAHKTGLLPCSPLTATSNCAHSLTMVLGLFVSRAPAFTSVLKAAIIGGDTDSNAAMLGALIGGIKGIRYIPPHYTEAVENGSTLVDLAGRFALLFMK